MITICVCNVANSAANEWKIIEALQARGIEAQSGSHYVNDLGGISADRPCQSDQESWSQEEIEIVNEVLHTLES